MNIHSDKKYLDIADKLLLHCLINNKIKFDNTNKINNKFCGFQIDYNHDHVRNKYLKTTNDYIKYIADNLKQYHIQILKLFNEEMKENEDIKNLKHYNIYINLLSNSIYFKGYQNIINLRIISFMDIENYFQIHEMINNMLGISNLGIKDYKLE